MRFYALLCLTTHALLRAVMSNTHYWRERQTEYDHARDQKIPRGFERRDGPDERQRDIFPCGGAATQVIGQGATFSRLGDEPTDIATQSEVNANLSIIPLRVSQILLWNNSCRRNTFYYWNQREGVCKNKPQEPELQRTLQLTR